MEAACVRAELRLRDGQNRTVSVQTGAGLSALSAAISELHHRAAQMLTELVDGARAGGARGDEESEEEEDEDGLNSDLQPEAKRSKTS